MSIKKVCLLLYGHPGAGKTSAALTLSNKWPGWTKVLKRTPKSKKLILDDILLFNWEPTGVNGLIQYNIEIKYQIDFLDLLSDAKSFYAGWSSGLLKGLSLIDKHEEIQAVVHDTITTADKHAFAWYFHPSRLPVSRRTGEPDTQKAYGDLLTFHRLYQTTASQLPEDVSEVYLTHVKILDEARATMAQKDVNDGKKMDGADVNKIPHITGSGYNCYTYPVELILPITRVFPPGKNPKPKRIIHTDYGANKYLVKNRYEGILNGKHEPDLGEIFRKVKGL